MPHLDEIPLAAIEPDPAQPRKHFDAGDLAELAASIRAFGLLQPIVVRPLDSGRFRIVMGERRWRACRLANLAQVPVRILPNMTDEQAFEAALAENLNRADMRPSEEAAAYATLLARGRAVADIATMYGKTTRWVQMFLDLLDLLPYALDQVDAGTLPLQVAWATSRLQPAGQQTVLRRWVRGEFTDARDAAAFAQACRDTEGQLALVVDTQDVETKQRIVRERRRLLSKIERLGHAGAILAEIGATDEKELAQLLAAAQGRVHVSRARTRAIDQAPPTARAQLPKAAAITAAATVAVTPGLLDDPTPGAAASTPAAVTMPIA